MTIGYRVMGSGPGPDRIGSGRHRLCGARVRSSRGVGRARSHVCYVCPFIVCKQHSAPEASWELSHQHGLSIRSRVQGTA